MKTAPPASSGIRKNSWEIITRFVAFSALSGLLLGTFEAAMLRSVPRVPVLLVPDIGFVEWFLAPLRTWFALGCWVSCWDTWRREIRGNADW